MTSHQQKPRGCPQRYYWYSARITASYRAKWHPDFFAIALNLRAWQIKMLKLVLGEIFFEKCLKCLWSNWEKLCHTKLSGRITRTGCAYTVQDWCRSSHHTQYLQRKVLERIMAWHTCMESCTLMAVLQWHVLHIQSPLCRDGWHAIGIKKLYTSQSHPRFLVFGCMGIFW